MDPSSLHPMSRLLIPPLTPHQHVRRGMNAPRTSSSILQGVRQLSMTVEVLLAIIAVNYFFKSYFIGFPRESLSSSYSSISVP